MRVSTAVRNLGLVAMVVGVSGGALSGCSPVRRTTAPGSADPSPVTASVVATPNGTQAAAPSSGSPAAPPVELLKAWALDVSDGRFWAAATYFADVPEVSIDGATHRPPDAPAVVEMLSNRFECGFDVLSTDVKGDEVRAYATGNEFTDRPSCDSPLPYSLVARFHEGKIESLTIDVVMPPN